MHGAYESEIEETCEDHLEESESPSLVWKARKSGTLTADGADPAFLSVAGLPLSSCSHPRFAEAQAPLKSTFA